MWVWVCVCMSCTFRVKNSANYIFPITAICKCAYHV